MNYMPGVGKTHKIINQLFHKMIISFLLLIHCQSHKTTTIQHRSLHILGSFSLCLSPWSDIYTVQHSISSPLKTNPIQKLIDASLQILSNSI
jgi:hypothetical protein